MLFICMVDFYAYIVLQFLFNMRKKLLFTPVFALLYFFANATHIVGGYMGYQWISDSTYLWLHLRFSATVIQVLILMNPANVAAVRSASTDPA